SSCSGWPPGVGRWIVATAGVNWSIVDSFETTPDDHFRAGPDCRVIASCARRIDRAGWRPSVGRWVVTAAGVVITAPDDHFRAGPDRHVTASCARRIDRAGWRPCIVRTHLDDGESDKD